MPGFLDGKVAIVTGGSRGIGAAICKLFSQEGASVVVNYSSSPDAASELVDSITKSGGKAIAVKGDVSKRADMENLFKATLEKFSKVDILVNNAGVFRIGTISNLTEEDFDRHMNINVKGTFFGCQLAAEHMQPGSTIINISSSSLGMMVPGYALYAATKGAVEQLTRHWSRELGPKGITINAIAPGATATELFFEGKAPETVEMFKNNSAFKRLGEVEDIAKVVLVFAQTALSGWVTGQVIRANGGTV